MSIGSLIGTMNALADAADRAAGAVRSVATATEDANSGIDGMANRTKDLVDQMKSLAEDSDIALWLKPIVDSFEAGKISAADFTKMIAGIKLELEALAARGARPVLGDFEGELQRLLGLIADLTKRG